MNLLSANAFNLNQSRILSFVKELITILSVVLSLQLDDDYDETDDIPLSKLAGKSRLSTKDKSKLEEKASQSSVSNTTSVIQKGQADVSQHVSAPNQPGPGPSPVNLSAQGPTPDVSTVSHQQPQINVHVHINQFPSTPTGVGEQSFPRSSGDNSFRDIQRASSDLQTLGEKFAKWFYDNLNSFNPGCVLNSKDFGPQHFWDDVHLEIEFYSPLLHREALDGPILVSQRLLAFPKEDNVLFNPNISTEGVYVKSNPHGLVKILACGSLHRGNACLGIFQQAFGIIRDPRFENNWKIKYTKMQMRTGEVSSLPKLEGDVDSQVNALVPL